MIVSTPRNQLEAKNPMNLITSRLESPPASRWSRLRLTFGPTVAGLLGGALTGLLAIPAMAPLCRNVVTTYAKFPSLSHPAALELNVPGWVSLGALLIGLAAPIAVGALVVWLVRPRDAWA